MRTSTTLLLAILPLAIIASCGKAPSGPSQLSQTITKVSIGEIFKYQSSLIDDGVPVKGDSALDIDTIVSIDSMISGKSHAVAYDGNGGAERTAFSYEADGNISVLLDEGDKVWAKLPIADGSTTFQLDTTVFNPGEYDHWIFTATKMSDENLMAGTASLQTKHIVVTWYAASSKSQDSGIVEKFNYWFAPEIGFFVRSEVEYLPIANGGVDEIDREDLIGWD